MNREALLGLALAAIDDEDSRVVLWDALESSGWTKWMVEVESPLDARLVAADLLCGEWPTSWPLAERCKVDLLHPNGRCSCWGEGTCDWCRLPCRHGGPQAEYCAGCDDEATEAMLAQEPMRTWLDDFLPGQRQGDGTEKV